MLVWKLSLPSQAAVHPHRIFFHLFPNWLLAPAVLLTTAATVIASQAVLSGAFALIQQAIDWARSPYLSSP
jgi:K+ transporter